MHVFLHGRLVDLMVYIYYPPLVSATLLGVGQQCGSSYRIFPSKTGTVGFSPNIIYFYKLYLSTLYICFLWLLSRVKYGHLGGRHAFLSLYVL